MELSLVCNCVDVLELSFERGVMYLWAKIMRKLRGASVKNSSIHLTSKVESGSHVLNTRMDRHSFCGYDCEISNCEIGSFCSIANGVVIGGGVHPMHWVSTSPVFYEGRDSVRQKFSTHKRERPKKTIIGHDVWIGRNALIKQGVVVGTGAVIGMGSVVTRDVPEYAVVAGVPARIIRMRFSEEVIKMLLASRWWCFDDEKLIKHANYFTKPRDFLEALE